jgi:hypothetical protein
LLASPLIAVRTLQELRLILKLLAALQTVGCMSIGWTPVPAFPCAAACSVLACLPLPGFCVSFKTLQDLRLILMLLAALLKSEPMQLAVTVCYSMLTSACLTIDFV